MKPNKDSRDSALAVRVLGNEDAMGRAAASEAGAVLRGLTAKKRSPVVCVFAAAPSQDSFLKHLCEERGINWSRVSAFHLDEYLDLPRNHPNTFEVYLREHILSRVKISDANMIKALKGSPTQIAKKYGSMLRTAVAKARGQGGAYLAFIGIGVNGHIAFNEPGTDIYSSKWVLPVRIDKVSVKQQFEDYKNHPDPAARYARLQDVPRDALTMTCAAILEADKIFCMVPGRHKAAAVQLALEGQLTAKLPASLLRLHRATTFFLDSGSAEKLSQRPKVAAGARPSA